MELKLYLRMLLRKWWVVITAFLVTFGSTMALTYLQPRIYEASATYLVVPIADEIRNELTTFSLLSSRSEIALTYAEVATSSRIKQQAVAQLDEQGALDGELVNSLSIQSQLIPGTIMLRVTGQGNDPSLVSAFTNQVGRETIDEMRRYYQTFELEIIDTAPIPQDAIRPNIPLNLGVGGVLGMALGIGLAIAATYFQTPTEQVRSYGIIDQETGVYNRRYFVQRLSEEMSRARRNGYTLSLGVMNADLLGVIKESTPQVRAEAIRRVAVLLQQYLREEDLIAHFSEAHFAFMLPDTSGVLARDTLEKLIARIAWTPIELENSGVKLNLSSSAGVVAYQLDDTTQDMLLAQANRALEEAQISGYGKVHLSD